MSGERRNKRSKLEHPPRRAVAEGENLSLMPALRTALGAWLASRIVTVVAGWYGVAVIPQPGQTTTNPLAFSLFRSYYCWDSGWYGSIIKNGYQWNGDPSAQQNVAFFPLYPMVAKAVSYVLPVSIEVAQLLVSQACFLAALFVLYLLAESFVGESASFAVYACALYPGAGFYFMGYSESLFLLLTIATFYFSHKHQWGMAACAGFLAALTRSLGFLLFIPLAIEYTTAVLQTSRRIDWNALAIPAPILGLLTYSGFLWARFGDPLAWSRAQLAWRPNPSPFFVTAIREWSYALQMPAAALLPLFDSNRSPTTFYFDWLAFVLVCAFTLLGIMRIPLSYSVWTAIVLLVPLQTGQSWNMIRFSSVAFPAFIALSSWLRKRTAYGYGWIAVSSSLLFAAVAYTLSNRYIA